MALKLLLARQLFSLGETVAKRINKNDERTQAINQLKEAVRRLENSRDS